jgi:hypothetical protein
VSLSFRYIAGYHAPAQAAVVEVLLLDATTLQPLLPPLYTSPPLDKYPYLPFDGYSPPVVVNVHGLAVSTDSPVKVALSIKNNARNLQIPIDANGFNVSVAWSP